MVEIKCDGPGVDWTELTPVERLGWLFFKMGNFTLCGMQRVELNGTGDDIFPEFCPVCKTDMNWNYDDVMRVIPSLETK